MKYLIAIAAILLLIVILKMQGCGVLDGMRERQQQRQEQRRERKEERKNKWNDRREQKRISPIPPDQNKQKRFMDNHRRFNRRERRMQR